MSRNAARILVAPLLLALAGGCQLLIGLDSGTPRKSGSGSGGAGGATSTSSTTTSSTGGAGGAGTGGGSDAGTDGGTDSGSDAGIDGGIDAGTDSGSDGGTDGGADSGVDAGCSCSAPPTCYEATCTDGGCGTAPIAGSCGGGKVCGTPGGTAEGTCVACNVDADCSALQTCSSSNQCAVPARVLLLAGGGGQGTVGVAYDVASGWGAPTALTTTTASDLALAVLPGGQGMGVIQGPANQVEYTFFNGPGASPAWSPFTQLNADVTRGKPALAVTGTTAHLVFQNATFFYEHESYAGGTWSTAPAPVALAGDAGTPTCGPSPGVLAPLPSGVSLIFVYGSCAPTTETNNLFNSDFTGGTWQPFKDMVSNPTNVANTFPPAALAAPLSGSPELLVAYSVQGSTQVQSSYRVAGAWMGYMPINGVLSSNELALAPLATSGVVLAYRGTDGNLYTTLYTVGSASWSTPAAPFASPTSILGPPAVAVGIGTAAAEMAYLDATGAVWHTRLIAGMWTTPVPVAMSSSGFANVAIASAP